MFHDATSRLCLFLPYLLCQVLSTKAVYIENIECNVYSQIVAVDSPSHRYQPYFITLQKCQGADSNPKRRICVPTKEEKINITVLNEGMFVYEEKTVTNHTQCKFACEHGASSCNKHEEWNSELCLCKCTKDNFNCGSTNKYWDKTDCKCSCKEEKVVQCSARGEDIDRDTCECMSMQRSVMQCSNALAIKYVVLIALVELVVVSAVCTIFVRRFCNNSNNSQDNKDKYEVEPLKIPSEDTHA